MLFSYPIARFLVSSMATQTDIPSELTDDDKALVFQILDSSLNSKILFALLHGEDHVWCLDM